MSTKFSDLIDGIRLDIGDTATLRHSTVDIRDTYMPAALDAYNAKGIQQFTFTGVTPDQTYSPDPTKPQIRLLQLYVSMKILLSDKAKYSVLAYITSNPAGRNDSTEIHKAVLDCLKIVMQDIKDIEAKETRYNVEDDMEGEELINTDPTTEGEVISGYGL